MFKNVLIGIDAKQNGRDPVALAERLLRADGKLTPGHGQYAELHGLDPRGPGLRAAQRAEMEKLLHAERVATAPAPAESATHRRQRWFDRVRRLRLLAPLALGFAYVGLLRRPILTWGATEDEAARSLPGDELLPHADGVATRAITIDAPAAAVWPWIVQMGPSPRGGAYTYDWVENLFGLNMHSVDRVLDECQHPELGDTIPVGANKMRLERLDPQRVLAWRSEDGNWVWTLVIAEGDGRTRLISRNRFRLPSVAARVGMLPMEPASLLMERKMLLGIKWRAERLAAASVRVGSPLQRG